MVYFYLLDNNDVDSDETQAEDPDLTYVPEDDYSQIIPDSVETEGWFSICMCMQCILYHAMYILKKISLETTGYGTSSTATSTTGHNTPTTGTSGRNTPSTATSGSNTSSTTPATPTASASTSSYGGANRRKGKPCVVLTSLTMIQSVDIIILRIHLQLAK